MSEGAYMEGQILGNRYEIIERIGGGGMAVVYKAKCNLLNRFVAVKILRDEFINDEEFVKRFRIEAQAAASLSHPNIVSIFDVGYDKNKHYIVMEYIDGITLKEYISKKGPLPWKEAVGIAIQICSALEQAHKNHIVHRDIKPHNILITNEGIAKVTDFGIARAVTSSTITMVGSTIGSVHYFSPEQARGGFTDEKSDLYSLGITIYEMCTGKVPFDGESPVAVALKHLQSKPERPIDVNPALPMNINNIIMKAIRKDQNTRYQSATELLADLQRSLKDPNATFADTNSGMEKFPTRKLQAVSDINYGMKDDIDEAEDKPSNEKEKKKDRLSVWLGVITGLVIAFIIFYIGFRIIIPAIMPDEKLFIAGNYVNRNITEVKDELKKSNIEAVEEKRVNNDNFEKDIIISQNVTQGLTLKPGGVIKFVVSDGPEMVTIPDVLGKESKIADQKLKDLNLQTTITKENSDTVGTGLVIRTDPIALTQVKPGDPVIIVESLGPKLKQVQMPNLKGLTRVNAEKLISDNNLKIGKITPSDVISDVAKIIKQYPAAGTTVDEGTPVEMTFDVAPVKTGDGTGTGNTTVQTQAWNITLDNREYGNEVLVYIEATPSDTNILYVVMNEKVKKSEFPITVNIPKSQVGKTHIVVKLDGTVVQEGDY